MPNPSNLSVKSKIWIENENGQVVFGTGRLYILQAISRHGSIHAAAQELQMSYRAVWGKIRATEKRLGHDLLDRKTGGVRGGGSKLTPLARQIIERFEKLNDLTKASADELFRDLFFSASRDEK
ncbi:MAG TPA: LysR family transcriptional regulator [Deltaproteobacteria bacterium]|jgi:molybdate transport system regulatory protein|nr:LysR family transcriptional regulator [Deltaproteobacteria bacterium]